MGRLLGTHVPGKGLEPLIEAWNSTPLPGWELHIAGRGVLTPKLEKMAEANRTIVFMGCSIVRRTPGCWFGQVLSIRATSARPQAMYLP